jgi:hypothetical protein
MKKLTVPAIVASLLVAFIGCELISPPPTALEQVEGFIAAASADTRNSSTMQSYFSQDAADYEFLGSDFYWEDDLRFFDLAGRPYTASLTESGSAPGFTNGTLVTGIVTSGSTDYTASFVVVSDPDNPFSTPLIRQIDVNTTVANPEITRINAFIAAANGSPPDYNLMKSQFHPDTAQYGSMQLSTYWDDRFFDDGDQPFSVTGATLGGEDPTYPGSTTVTGTADNFLAGYAATFVLLENADGLFGEPLIRKISVASGDADILNVAP